jgi:hypothetical protein
MLTHFSSTIIFSAQIIFLSLFKTPISVCVLLVAISANSTIRFCHLYVSNLFVKSLCHKFASVFSSPNIVERKDIKVHFQLHQ